MKRKMFIILELVMLSLVLFIIIKATVGNILLPRSQSTYVVEPHEKALEPQTQLQVQVTFGQGLLLKGKGKWAVEVDRKNDIVYYYDIQSQTVSTLRYDDKTSEFVNKKLPSNVLDGIEMRKDGLVIKNNRDWFFEMSTIDRTKVTLKNISDAPLTYQIWTVYR